MTIVGKCAASPRRSAASHETNRSAWNEPRFRPCASRGTSCRSEPRTKHGPEPAAAWNAAFRLETIAACSSLPPA